jgi:hypothetical protein
VGYVRSPVRFAAERQRHEGRWIVKLKVLGENTVRLTIGPLSESTWWKDPGFTAGLPLENVIGVSYRA